MPRETAVYVHSLADVASEAGGVPWIRFHSEDPLVIVLEAGGKLADESANVDDVVSVAIVELGRSGTEVLLSSPGQWIRADV
ncbi:hypothetical protein [Halomicrobium urmianum]|uniref:hypothetical protein n=1 Tax=Halomicrobium urmianum TaxID=1586233 RepID=UPI001CDA1797|nr:hypothetical protein [Halomicrobium urmianum]